MSGTDRPTARTPSKWDLFISHATEDKDVVARPLANELVSRGLGVWYDEFELKVGDSLRASIDEGLAQSHHGIVVLSEQFFAKSWPLKELNGLVALEAGGRRRILPVWHGVDRDEVACHSPMLADLYAAKSDQPIKSLADELIAAMDMAPRSATAATPDTELALSPPPTEVELSLVASGASVLQTLAGQHEYTFDIDAIGDEAHRSKAAAILDELRGLVEAYPELDLADREQANVRASDLMVRLLESELLMQVGHYERRLTGRDRESAWRGAVVRVAPAAVIAAAQHSADTPSAPPSPPPVADQRQLDALLGLVTRQSIRRIREQDFASPWPDRITTPLQLLVNEYDEVEHQFEDEGLETARQRLMQAANQFLYIEAMNGFVNRHARGMRDAGYTPTEADGIPDREQLLERRRSILWPAANDVVEVYDALVATAKARGYSIEALNSDDHPRVSEHDARMTEASGGSY